MSVTANPVRKGRSFYFVDNIGGALSLLAAGVARSMGLDASAATSAKVSAAPEEIATVLEEVGMRHAGGDVAALDGHEGLEGLEASAKDVVFLGKTQSP